MLIFFSRLGRIDEHGDARPRYDRNKGNPAGIGVGL